MKKFFSLLVISGILAQGVTGCLKPGEYGYTFTSEDETLAGTVVTAGDSEGLYYKLFVLNEGQQGTNGAELDFLRITDGKYVNSAFGQMNNNKKLGDVANDIKVYGNTLWLAVTNSGLVVVLDASNEKEIAEFPIPTPRGVTFSGDYAYVSSWGYNASPSQNETIDVKGAVYRINLSTSQSDSEPIPVGYQPEGIVATRSGSVWVANSGGVHGYMAGEYERTIQVIEPNFSHVTSTIEVADNLKDLLYDSDNEIVWATSPGDFFTVHSGVYPVSVAQLAPIERSAELAAVRFTCASLASEGRLFVIGTDDEWDWAGPRHYNFYMISSNGGVEKIPFDNTAAAVVSNPYAIQQNPVNGDVYITDAGDYVNPGMLYCFDKNLDLKWKVATGVCPGHLALYALAVYY